MRIHFWSLYRKQKKQSLLTAASKDPAVFSRTTLQFPLLFILLNSIMKAECPLENINQGRQMLLL